MNGVREGSPPSVERSASAIPRECGSLATPVSCVVFAVATFTAGMPASAADCAAVLELHGFLRWSANRCGSADCNPAIVDDARQCFDRIGRSAAGMMYAGRDRFEHMAEVRGRDAACAEIARSFPMVVR